VGESLEEGTRKAVEKLVKEAGEEGVEEAVRKAAGEAVEEGVDERIERAARDTRAPRRALPVALRATLAWHAAMAAGFAIHPQWWPAWAAGLLADHGLLAVAGLLPRSAILGPNLRRLPEAAAARGEVALTFDDGPDPEVTPAVLSLLAQADARATFFCIGERLRRHPALAREIVACGHAIENHTQRHRHDFSLLGPARIEREVVAMQRTVAELAGAAPRFFRAPAGLRNALLEPVLARLGLQLASWTRRGYDTASGDARRVRERLARGLGGGDILLLHDGNAARDGRGKPVVLEVLPRLLDDLAARGLCSVTLREALP